MSLNNVDDSTDLIGAIRTFAAEFPDVVSVTIKHLDGKLWEMKVGGFRVLYGVANDSLLVVHVFAKKSRKTPKGDLDMGKKRLKFMTAE